MNILKKKYDLLFLHTHIKIQFTTFKETGYNFFYIKVPSLPSARSSTG